MASPKLTPSASTTQRKIHLPIVSFSTTYDLHERNSVLPALMEAIVQLHFIL